MNIPLIRWLFDLRNIPEDAEYIRLVWERPLPPWLWALLLLAAGLFAIWSYSRLSGWRPGRGLLSGVRLALILLVLVVLSGPMFEMPRETVEPDWVLTLVDRSRSMQIADVIDESGRRTRDEQLRDMLAQSAPLWAQLDENRELIWLGFHEGAFALERPDESETVESDESLAPPVNLADADGARTSLNAALEQALQRAAARPVSGIVVFSDGQTTDPPSRALVRQLQAEAVRVYVVPLGSSDALADLALGRVDVPRRAFVRDKVPVVVNIDRGGAAASEAAVTMRLVDELSGEELARETLEPGATDEEVTLIAEPMLAGRTTWRVEIETDQPTLVPENLVRQFEIDLVDRPLRVLFIDGYPRWEYRYVKNLLVREQSIESSVMLISADRDFAQEGNQPITRLPRSPGEFAEFDVIVLGDVPAGFFTTAQLEMMRDHVSDRGAGLLWIAGPRSTPQSYAGSTLADLLPIRGSLNVGRIDRPVLMEPTDLARRLGVLRLVGAQDGADEGWPRELVDSSYGWSLLQYAQQIEPDRLKPTAEVLAQTTAEAGIAPLPLVMLMRYGAGKSVYVATDEIWRWRYGRGELLPEQFWVQLLRMLGRESLATSGQAAVLEVMPRRAQTRQPVRLELHVLDAQLVESSDASLPAVVLDESGATVAEVVLERLPGSEDRYVATMMADQPGAFRVRVVAPEWTDRGIEASLEVFTPEDELRRPETDHVTLIALAEATGGEVLDGESLLNLSTRLPDRSITTENPLTERIWDTPFFLILLIGLLTLEWIGRKVLRLA